MESPTVGTPPEGHTAQASAEVSEEVELTTEIGETPTLQDLPKNSTSLDLQLGKEVLMS